MRYGELFERFWVLLAVAVGVTLAFPIAVKFVVSGADAGTRQWLELLAWACITCTYLLFLPAEILGPREGLKRLVAHPWSVPALYASVFSGAFGVVAGTSLLYAIGVGSYFGLPLLAVLFVVYQFLVRHWLTEAKRTPHLGQRGDPRQRRNERWWGQAGDLALVLLLLAAHVSTSHPLWLFGAIILFFGYMSGVWIHGWLDREAEPGSSYLLVLIATVLACAIVLLLGFVPRVRNLDAFYGNSFLAALAAVLGVFSVARTAAALVAAGLLALGTVFGLLLSENEIPTSFAAMLLNGNVRRFDYALFLVVVCCALNVFLAHFVLVLPTYRRGATSS